MKKPMDHVYAKLIKSDDEIKEAIFKTLTATIETVRERALPSATVRFEYMGMKCSVLIKREGSKS